MKNTSPQRILVMICVLHFATHIYTTFLQPLNLELKLYFHLELDRQITLIPTIMLLCYAAANLFSGLVATRVQPRTMLAAGPCVNGLCIMAMYFLKPDQYVGLCVLTAVGSAGGGLYHPVANSLLTRVFPDNKGKALGYSGIGACMAFVLAPWLSSSFVHGGILSWQQVCLLYGAIGCGCGVLALIYVPLQETTPASSHAHEEFRLSLSDPIVRSVALFSAVLIVVMGGREMVSWGTAAITQQFVNKAYPGGDLNPGMLVGALFLPGVVVQPLAGRWSDALGRERVLCVSLFCICLALLLLPLSPRSLIIPAYLFLGAAVSSSVPTMEALVADRAPAKLRGVLYGVVITSAIFIGSLSPILVGAVADAGGRTADSYRHAFWTLMLISLGSFTLAFALKPVARRLGVLRYGPQHEGNAVPLDTLETKM